MLGTKVDIFWEVPLLGMGFVFGRAKVFHFSSYIVPRHRVHPPFSAFNELFTCQNRISAIKASTISN